MSVAVTNSAKTPQTFMVQAANAVTNSNGIITYNQGAAKTAPKHVAFSDLLPERTKATVTIPAGHTQTVAFTVTTPQTPFNGLVLGAFSVRSLTAAQAAQKQGGFANLANYVIGVSLTENHAKITPHLTYHGAKYASQNHLPHVAITLANTQPVIIGTVHLTAKVTDEHGKVVAATEQAGLNFAPSNRFDYHLATKANRALAAGKYRLQLKIKADNGQWSFDRHFTVTKNTVKHTKVAHFINWKHWLWLVIDGLAVLIIIGFLLNLILRRNKRH
ncbi:WxL protein host-binding domain-containing protein [Lacticaseibacillus baoqingensis]|uniref:WxL protein host-binding domain-containing protein n=1 Tax=Lacticaseibacillus baoqingensis TaxID=2486013 RepID=A0ABW4E3I7_9LACO|nr:DUF3324 domain-containing protein [Lacticaseibacillus baoqingensis]